MASQKKYNKIILFLSFSVLFDSLRADAQKKFWFSYSPVQEKVVGKLFQGKLGEQVIISGMSIVPNVTTDSQKSANSEKADFNKNFALGLKFFVNKYAKIESVEAAEIVKDDITNNWQELKAGTFVYSGLRANSVTITLSKNSKTEITPARLLDGIKQFSVISDASAINAIKLIDSINFSKNSSWVVRISNPHIYYSIQVAKIEEMYGPSDYYINMLGKGVGTMTLNKDRKATPEAYPVISPEFENTIGEIKIDLVRKFINGKMQLFVRFPDESLKTDDKTSYKEIPMFDDESWNCPNFLVHSYQLGNNAIKKIWLNIKAEKIGEDIKIIEATLTYPEKKITFLTNREL